MTSSTTVTIDTNWSNIIPKGNSWQAVQNAGKDLGTKIWVVSVAIGSSVTYATGGISVSLDPKNQIIDEYLAVIPISSTVGVEFQYLPSATGNTGKIQCFVPSSSPNSATALVELTSGATILQSTTMKFLVIAS